MSYRLSLDREEMNIMLIHKFLTNSYWAKGVSMSVLEKAFSNSFCFGLFDNNQQVSFGRFITDRATYAYLADVFVLPEYQGRGLAKMMMKQVLKHPDLIGLRRIMLATRDAHGLYEKLGFEMLSDPSVFMQCWTPNVYQS